MGKAKASATNDASREIGGAFGIAIVGSLLNEVYQRKMVVPEGLEGYSGVVSESFPAAIQIGAELLSQGNSLGDELIKNARWAFVEGMTEAAVVPALVALVNAVIVKVYMPRRAVHIGPDAEV